LHPGLVSTNAPDDLLHLAVGFSAGKGPCPGPGRFLQAELGETRCARSHQEGQQQDHSR
jgi:hypothetical protein